MTYTRDYLLFLSLPRGTPSASMRFCPTSLTKKPSPPRIFCFPLSCAKSFFQRPIPGFVPSLPLALLSHPRMSFVLTRLSILSVLLFWVQLLPPPERRGLSNSEVKSPRLLMQPPVQLFSLFRRCTMFSTFLDLRFTFFHCQRRKRVFFPQFLGCHEPCGFPPPVPAPVSFCNDPPLF